MGACMASGRKRVTYFKLTRLDNSKDNENEEPLRNFQLSNKDIQLAKLVWTRIRERYEDEVGVEIFRQLFHREPKLKQIFGVTALSDDIALYKTALHRHTLIFQDVINILIVNLSQTELISDSFIELGAQHWVLNVRGFEAEFWLIFGDVLLNLVLQVSRRTLPSTRQAMRVWREAIVFLLDCMQLGYLRMQRIQAKETK